jgi:hypothetical protein
LSPKIAAPAGLSTCRYATSLPCARVTASPLPLVLVSRAVGLAPRGGAPQEQSGHGKSRASYSSGCVPGLCQSLKGLTEQR